MIRPAMTESMKGQPGLLYITSHGPPLIINPALMGEESPQMNGGFATWEEITRRQKKSLTEWTGTTPYRMSIPIIFDGYSSNESIEANIAGIENLGRPEGGRGEKQPPTFQVHIPGQVPRGKNINWVLEGIDWGPTVKRTSDGKRIRQTLTINVLEYVNPDTIEIDKRVADPKHWVYKTKDGDTLRKIAKHELGNAKHWKDIKKLNSKFRDPNKVIKTGTHLKMPPKPTIKHV